MSEPNGPEAHFLLRCPVERLEELQETLWTAGFNFNQIDDQFYLNHDHVLDGVFTGNDAGEFIRQLNIHLEENGSPRRLSLPYGDMTPAERHSLLYLVNTSVLWKSDYDYQVEHISRVILEEFAEQNSRLFTIPEGKTPEEKDAG